MLGSFRKTLSVLLILGAAVAVVQAGCGSSGDGSTFGGGAPDGAVDPNNPGQFEPGGDGSAQPGSDADPDALGTLVITPPTATITASLVNGALVAAPVTFTASYNGQTVPATWLFDRAELGDVSNTGVFTANGTNVGDGIVTARFGAREGNAKIKVNLTQSQNGVPTGFDAGGGTYGGVGGVGGEPLGGAVSTAVETKLKTESNAPANADELSMMYPYDKTVWPRGLLPPLLMWKSTKTADAVYVKLSQGNYTFEGSYSMAGLTGNANKRVRLENGAWKAATGGNTGDDLQLDVKIYVAAENKVYGPITEKWKVAPGVLKGTVYYNSYDSHITTNGGAETGGVIKIQPKGAEPSLAIPSMAGKCHVCHTLSADGSTLFVQDGKVTYPNGGDDYRNGASYDLTKANTPRTSYLGATDATQDRKFNWAAPYPDGSFALASSRFAREAYLKTDSKLFKRADGSEQASTGLTGVVTSAVTPTYSPDGRKVAFNFWEGTATNGVTPGAGRNLVMMDFSCGAVAGSTKCAPAGPFAFSGIREVYNNPSTYPAWPSFLPDGKAVVFNNEVAGGSCGGGAVPDRNSENNCQTSTWFSAKSELWIARDTVPATSRKLDAANGISLPTNADHPDDTQLNYQPTVNPVPSGGYYWVVFTSRRIYGNVHDGKPWGTDGQSGGPIKKLWVAAIDINAPAGNGDPSHPAFYLPGQELEAGNTRGFWVVDPCKSNGNSCETGDECCNGFCRKDADGGALVCSDKPPGQQCSQEFEKCTVGADCCDATQMCINGKCSRGAPPPN